MFRPKTILAFAFLLNALSFPLCAQDTAQPKDPPKEVLADTAKTSPEIEAKVKEYQLYIEDKNAALAAAKAKLKITDKQTALWDAFVKMVMKNNKEKSDFAAKLGGSCGAEPAPNASSQTGQSLINTLNQIQERREFDLKQQKAFMAALTPLYNSFSAEQKKIADDMVYQMSFLM